MRLRLTHQTSKRTDDEVIVEAIDSILCDLDPRDEMDLINWWLEIRLDLDKNIKESNAGG